MSRQIIEIEDGRSCEQGDEFQKRDTYLETIMKELDRGGSKEHYMLKNGVLYKGRNKGGEVLVLHKDMVKEVLVGIHDKNGHQGVERIVDLVNRRYTWIGRYTYIREYFKKCKVCLEAKIGSRPRVKMWLLEATITLNKF